MSFCRSRALCGQLTLRASVAALDMLNVLMEDDSASGNPTLQLIAGYIYSYEQEYEKALRAVHNGYTLEQCAPNRVQWQRLRPPPPVLAMFTPFVSCGAG